MRAFLRDLWELLRKHVRVLAALGAALVVLVLGWTGFWGFLVLTAGTLLGMTAPLSGVRRTQAMGFLLVPTILFYSGLTAPVVTLLHSSITHLPSLFRKVTGEAFSLPVLTRKYFRVSSDGLSTCLTLSLKWLSLVMV